MNVFRGLEAWILRSAGSLIMVVGTATLMGCSDSDFELTAHDAVGTWRAGSDLPAQLELAENGTFTATSWPLDAGCNVTSPLTIDALQESGTSDRSGVWEEGEGGSVNQLTLFPDGDVCRSYRIAGVIDAMDAEISSALA